MTARQAGRSPSALGFAGTAQAGRIGTIPAWGGSWGELQGSLHVDGTIENRGSRGGSVTGAGEVRDLPGSRVVQPVVRGGANVYEW
jgi:hypothetical protein